MAKSGKGAPRRMKNDSKIVAASYKKKKVEKYNFRLCNYYCDGDY